MVLRLRVALGERLLDEHVDRVAVLGVHHHERARLGRDLHRPEERLVVDHERALVGHEELVRGDALVGQRRELLERAALLQVGDGHVVAHVDHLLAVRPSPSSRRARRRSSCPAAGCTKSTWQVVPPRAAARWPDSTSSIVTVPPNGMSRCVCGSTAPGSTYLPGRVDHAVGLDVERLADQGDPLVLDEDVADVVVRRRDDAASLDQNGHCGSPSSVQLSAALLAALGDLDLLLLVALALDVDAVVLELLDGRLGVRRS